QSAHAVAPFLRLDGRFADPATQTSPPPPRLLPPHRLPMSARRSTGCGSALPWRASQSEAGLHRPIQPASRPDAPLTADAPPAEARPAPPQAESRPTADAPPTASPCRESTLLAGVLRQSARQ